MITFYQILQRQISECCNFYSFCGIIFKINRLNNFTTFVLFVLCEIYCVVPSTTLLARHGTLNLLPFCQKNKNYLSLHADITNKMLEKSYFENSAGITQYYNYSCLCTLCGSRISVIPFHWNGGNPYDVFPISSVKFLFETSVTL
jgi:hypothetical protein